MGEETTISEQARQYARSVVREAEDLAREAEKLGDEHEATRAFLRRRAEQFAGLWRFAQDALRAHDEAEARRQAAATAVEDAQRALIECADAAEVARLGELRDRRDVERALLRARSREALAARPPADRACAKIVALRAERERACMTAQSTADALAYSCRIGRRIEASELAALPPSEALWFPLFARRAIDGYEGLVERSQFPEVAHPRSLLEQVCAEIVKRSARGARHYLEDVASGAEATVPPWWNVAADVAEQFAQQGTTTGQQQEARS